MSVVKKVLYAIKTDKSIKEDKNLTPEDITEILKKKKKFKNIGKGALTFAVIAAIALTGRSYVKMKYMKGGKRKSKKRSRKKSKKSK